MPLYQVIKKKDGNRGAAPNGGAPVPFNLIIREHRTKKYGGEILTVRELLEKKDGLFTDVILVRSEDDSLLMGFSSGIVYPTMCSDWSVKSYSFDETTLEIMV